MTLLHDPWAHANTTPATSVPTIADVTPATPPPVTTAATEPAPVHTGPRVRSTNVNYGVPEMTPRLNISGLRKNFMLLIPQDQCREYTVKSGEFEGVKINAVALILNSNPTFYTEKTGQGEWTPLEWESKPVEPGGIIPLSVYSSSIRRLLQNNYNQIYLPKGSPKTILRGKVDVTVTKDRKKAVIFVPVETPPADVLKNISNPAIAAKIRAFEDEYADFLFEPA